MYQIILRGLLPEVTKSWNSKNWITFNFTFILFCSIFIHTKRLTQNFDASCALFINIYRLINSSFIILLNVIPDRLSCTSTFFACNSKSDYSNVVIIYLPKLTFELMWFSFESKNRVIKSERKYLNNHQI